MCVFFMFFFFFFNDTASTEIYTLFLHDALPISESESFFSACSPCSLWGRPGARRRTRTPRSEEHTSELQSRPHLVCRLLLEKKKKKTFKPTRRHTTSIHTPDTTISQQCHYAPTT